MWTPQFAKAGEQTSFGIGFMLTQRAGCRAIGHSGAIYGFATELAALPDEKLGVAVVASKDCANAVTRHIADVSLDQMLAVRKGSPLPKIEETAPFGRSVPGSWSGRYANNGKGVGSDCTRRKALCPAVARRVSSRTA